MKLHLITQTVIDELTASCRSYLGSMMCVPGLPWVLGDFINHNDNHNVDVIIIHNYDYNTILLLSFTQTFFGYYT